ncbi:MAG: site-specific integrase [Devosia sp.]
MGVEQNMRLRGAVWTIRLAVPKALRALREQAGQPPGPREVWQSLKTGDHSVARRRLAEAKAALLREFDDESTRLAESLARPPRVVPNAAQIEQAVFAFKAQERAELYRERLQYLPTGAQVRAAQDQRFILDSAPLDPQETGLARLMKRLDFDVVIDRKQALATRRQVLATHLREHLADNEFVLIDWAITGIADQHGYLIEQDDQHYRLLGTLLLKAWIQELEAADDVFMNLDVPATTATLFQQGHLGTQQPGNDPVAPLEGSPTSAQTAERDILKLFETYLAEQKSGQSSSRAAESRRAMQQFVEVSGVRDVTLYRKANVTTYKKKMQLLPPNAARDYPGKTVDEIIRLKPVGAATLKAKTVNARLSVIAVFGKWLAETTDEVVASNFVTAPLPIAGTSDKMSEFTDAEVCSIFLNPTYTGCQGERNQTRPGTYRVRDYRFWLPLMAAFTGCRLNELAQLRVDDVFQRDGILAINVTDAGDGQSLKNQQSNRIVPVHSTLIELGFSERVDAAKAKGESALFHDIPVDRQGRRSETAGKRFRKYIQRIGVKTEGARGGMHRFRHTVVEKLRASGLYDHQIAPLVGHGSGIALMTADYGSSRQMTVEQRKEAIERIHYEGLDVARLG